LQNSGRGLAAFKANGKCKAKFYEKDKDKPRNEQFPVKIWLDPPGNLRFLGDVAFNARGLDVGSNKLEFWFTAKPNELGNIYVWGKWTDQQQVEDLLLNPALFLQAFGIIDFGDKKSWALDSIKKQDVLIQKDKNGKITRRVTVNNCDYRVEKIEYFDIDGIVIATLGLSDYQMVLAGNKLPENVLVTHRNDDGSHDSFEIKLDSINPQDSIKKAIFKKPNTRGFKNVYQLIDGKAVQQK